MTTKIRQFLEREIWEGSNLEDRTVRGKTLAALRILSIVWTGLENNRLASRSAALSYYSLIALGPLVAIMVMVSGFAVQSGEGDLAVNALNRTLQFIAPPVAQYSSSASEPPADPPHQRATDGAAIESDRTDRLNPKLVDLIEHVIGSARSGAVGAVGLLVLIVIGIQLLTSIENTLNEIWGVRRGRSWAQRIVIYWTFISLGALLALATMTFFSATTLAELFRLLPFGFQLSQIGVLLAPLASFILIALILSAFYHFSPNTQVRWRPCLVGSLCVTLLLFLNNYLSFLYVQRVISTQSLYGSVGIVPVLMIGLYIFWFFILLGGLVTYAFQNADFLTSQKAWYHISSVTRETVALSAMLLICRRFRDSLSPPTAEELGRGIRAPGQVVNECLTRLTDLGWISAVIQKDELGADRIHYQPARPLDRFTVVDFKQSFDRFGNNEGIELILRADPLVEHLRRGLDTGYADDLAKTSMAELLDNSGRTTESESN